MINHKLDESWIIQLDLTLNYQVMFQEFNALKQIIKMHIIF